MSGGAFDYNQRTIGYIAEQIQEEIDQTGKEKTISELKDRYGYDYDRWIAKYPEDKYHHQYATAVLAEMKNAVKYLKIAEIYAQRVDWMLSGDDSPETFIDRVKEDLDELLNKNA